MNGPVFGQGPENVRNQHAQIGVDHILQLPDLMLRAEAAAQPQPDDDGANDTVYFRCGIGQIGIRQNWYTPGSVSQAKAQQQPIAFFCVCLSIESFGYRICSRRTLKSLSGSMGFVRWSSMPASCACRTSSSKASPVIAITGTLAASARSSARRARVAS